MKEKSLDQNLCEEGAGKYIDPWHIVDEFNNGTIMDIRTKTLYDKSEYFLTAVDDKEKFLVCDVAGDEKVVIIYFDDIQNSFLVTL